MSTSWTEEEVFKLIKQWEEESIQEQLEGSNVYEKLSSALAKVGMKKSGEQCRSKVKKLRSEYKKMEDNHVNNTHSLNANTM